MNGKPFFLLVQEVLVLVIIGTTVLIVGVDGDIWDTIREMSLEEHNKYRETHHSIPFNRDYVELSFVAEACGKVWAKLLRQGLEIDPTKCDDDHDLTNIGVNYEAVNENIGLGDFDKMKAMLRGWYSNKDDYDFDEPQNSKNKFRVFTQMVWNSSRKIGFGRTLYNGRENTLITVVYSPIGNVELVGEDKWAAYKKNVFSEDWEPCPCPESTTETEATTQASTTTEQESTVISISTFPTTTEKEGGCGAMCPSKKPSKSASSFAPQYSVALFITLVATMAKIIHEINHSRW